jgi:glycine oxidase
MAGLSAAVELNRLGACVKVFDAGEGASMAAAGMLSPIHELDYTETDLLNLGIAARNHYPAWLDSLDISPQSVGLRFDGALEVAVEPHEIPELRRQFDFQRRMGLKVEWLDALALRDFEPALGPEVCAGIFAPEEGRVDPRLLRESLIKRVEPIIPNLVVSLVAESGGVKITDATGQEYFSKTVLLATGAGFPAFASGFSVPTPQPDIVFPGAPEIHPVRGEMLSVSAKGFSLRTTVRIRSRRWGRGYVVPHPDRIVVGSTSEERGRDLSVTMGGLSDIVRRAYAAVPGLFDRPVAEVWTGLRPATLSRKPLVESIGPSVFVFNGLYRHGILLAPLLASRVAKMMAQAL